ncbi:MAG TPA: hypothetical protein VGW58_15100, partial [Pyrinomonadaceae bacterium]|nr:hypothetical protein [Pyrinomonadaceae bacterium]
TDGGKKWSNLISNVSGMPKNSPVSHVEPSRTSANTTYISFDRHMFDDFRPYIFKTVDSGKSWTNISGNLPAKAYVQVVREDPKNTNLLYAGTELGLFVSYTGGKDWLPLNLKNLPNVAVHDILVHPRENDLILATHGRSIWILDDATPSQRITQQIWSSSAYVFPIRPALRFSSRFTRYGIGDKQFTGPNPPAGALITYYLKDKVDDKTTFKVQVFDRDGKLVQDLEKPSREQGLNRIAWNLRLGGPEVRKPPTEEQLAFGGAPRGPQVLPGIYTVKLTLGDRVLEERVEVKLDSGIKTSLADLQQTQDMQVKLRDMQTNVNMSLRFFDSLKEQLKAAQTTMKTLNKEPDKDLMKSLEDYIKQLDTMQDRLAARNEGLGFPGRDQVTDNIGNLFFSLDTNFGPTLGQRQFFEEIQPEYRSRMEEVNKFLRETLPQWNEKLRGWNAPTLTTRKPFDL